LASLLTSIAVASMSAAVIFLFAKDGFGTFQFAFLRTLYGFFIGHLTYRLWKADLGINVGRWAGLLEVGAVATVIAYISLLPLDEASPYCFAAPIIFAAVIWIFAHERGPVSHLMSSPPVLVLGERSYSIYMVHAPIVLVLDRIADVLQHRVNSPLKIELMFPWADKPISLMFLGNLWLMDVLTIGYLLFVIMTAGMTYKLIERPGRTFFNSLKWAQTRKPASNKPADFTMPTTGVIGGAITLPFAEGISTER
jgi:peptidoglycan/LPS O-acetylase OafA/YrhL